MLCNFFSKLCFFLSFVAVLLIFDIVVLRVDDNLFFNFDERALLDYEISLSYSVYLIANVILSIQTLDPGNSRMQPSYVRHGNDLQC